MIKFFSILILSIFLSNTSLADSYSGTTYNWETGEYHNVDVEFNGSELEVYNWNTGEYEYHDIDTNNGEMVRLKLIIGKLEKIIQFN